MMSRKTMSAAIAMAQREEMLRDESVYIMGLDVGPYGGAFGCTRGLWQEFGDFRSGICGGGGRFSNDQHAPDCRITVY